MNTRDRLSPLQEAFLEAMARAGGGGREADLQRDAFEIERLDPRSDVRWRGLPSTLHNHYSKGADDLANKGFAERRVVGSETQWWITDDGWRRLGREGPAPRPAQETLL